MIDSSAIVDPSAVLGENVSIGPWTIIGPNVEIGDGCEIASHVVIKGPTVIGRNNKIFQFATLGEDTRRETRTRWAKTYARWGSSAALESSHINTCRQKPQKNSSSEKLNPLPGHRAIEGRRLHARLLLGTSWD